MTKLSHISSLAVVLGIVSLPAQINATSLVSSVPADGATEVSVTAPVSFTFDTEIYFTPTMFWSVYGMVPAIQWSPQVTFSYAPSADGMTVTCTPTSPLPANTTITWTLNPPNVTFGFQDYDANELPTTTGSFTTAGSGGNSNTNDYGVYTLSKTLGYLQTNDTATIPYSDESAIYGSSVVYPAANPITAVTLVLPNAQTRTFMQFPGQTNLSDFDLFSTQTALDTAFPAGTYTFNLQRQSGSSTVTMAMPKADAYPPIPSISNFTAAQSIDPTKPFTFNWAAIAGATSADSIHFYIEMTNSAVEIFSSETNAGTSTSITIPANLLSAGTTYQGMLAFTRMFYTGTNSTAKMVGFGAMGRTTYFSITASGGTPVSQPKFTGYSSQANGRFSLTIAGTPGSTLIIDAGTTVGAWQPVFTNTFPVGGSVTYEDAAAIGQAMRFYRARSR